ncbi:MAG: PIG-L deacetylase family protein [Janthinobacterium lividum]
MSTDLGSRGAPCALFVSPHLDDVAFSCGALASVLADAGWRTVLATVFTRSVVPAEGFALACQLDKGLGAEVDYMALRRDEDRAAARLLGFAECLHLDLPEAPHRGYGSAAELFAGVRGGDDVWRAVAEMLGGLEARVAPSLVLAPQGLGGHADHRQVVRAVREAAGAPVWWYRDTPYAIRHGEGTAPEEMAGLGGVAVAAGGGMARKVAAACAYASQVGFQFGGAEGTAAALRAFARDEAGRAEAAGEALGGLGGAAERFLCAAGDRGALGGVMRGAA